MKYIFCYYRQKKREERYIAYKCTIYYIGTLTKKFGM